MKDDGDVIVRTERQQRCSDAETAGIVACNNLSMKRWAFLSLILTTTSCAVPENAPAFTRAPAVASMQSSFVTSNGVRLHYIDHGGQGPVIVMLAGMGDGAHVFDDLGPILARDHRVLALTRRGYGQSEKPVTGYDTDTLVADLVGVMDALGIGRATFVGHSLAGNEMTRLAGLYPDRVARLVYLDAAYDRENLPKLIQDDPAGEPQPGPGEVKSFDAFEAWYQRMMGIWSSGLAANLREMYRAPDGALIPSVPRVVGQAIYEGMVAFRPDYLAVRAPALAIYAIQAEPDLPSDADPALRARAQTYVDTVYAPWQREQAQRFKREVTCSEIVLMPGAHHYMFVQRQAKTVDAIQNFLNQSAPCGASAPGE